MEPTGFESVALKKKPDSGQGKEGPKHQALNPFRVRYDSARDLLILEILDPETVSSFLLKDPEAGTYKISRTKLGRLHMGK